MANPEYRPDQPSLLGSRLKLKRAKEHLDELEPEIRAYSDRHPYGVAEKDDREGEWTIVRMGKVREHPQAAWGVRVGEFLHDLRSALDNLVWQLVQTNGQQPGDHNQFPIYSDPLRPPGRAREKPLKGVRGATRLDDMLLGVEAAHVATIKDLQPYLGFHIHGQHKAALAGLAFMNNIDKHRFMHPAMGFSQRGDERPEILHIAGPRPTSVDVEWNLGPIYEGAEVFRWRVVGTPESKVAMKGGVPFDIAFGHENTTLSHLDWLRERIEEIVEKFAPAFPADPDGT